MNLLDYKIKIHLSLTLNLIPAAVCTQSKYLIKSPFPKTKPHVFYNAFIPYLIFSILHKMNRLYDTEQKHVNIFLRSLLAVYFSYFFDKRVKVDVNLNVIKLNVKHDRKKFRKTFLLCLNQMLLLYIILL